MRNLLLLKTIHFFKTLHAFPHFKVMKFTLDTKSSLTFTNNGRKREKKKIFLIKFLYKHFQEPVRKRWMIKQLNNKFPLTFSYSLVNLTFSNPNIYIFKKSFKNNVTPPLNWQRNSPTFKFHNCECLNITEIIS